MRRVRDCETDALGFLRPTRLGDAAHYKQHKKFPEQATEHFHDKTFAPESLIEF